MGTLEEKELGKKEELQMEYLVMIALLTSFRKLVLNFQN